MNLIKSSAKEKMNTMTGWAGLDLSKINPNLEIVPEGVYTFSLSGAKYGDRDPGRLEVTATLVTEGDFTGRKLFFSYPDPGRPNCDWSIKALKRFESALGVDQLPGEDPVSYLNRAAGTKFNAKIGHSKATDEYPNPRAELKIFTVAPAA